MFCNECELIRNKQHQNNEPVIAPGNKKCNRVMAFKRYALNKNRKIKNRHQILLTSD